MSAWAQGRMTMSRQTDNFHNGMHGGLMSVGVALVAGQRARRVAQAWAQADADAESAVHRLGQVLLASRRREAELSETWRPLRRKSGPCVSPAVSKNYRAWGLCLSPADRIRPICGPFADHEKKGDYIVDTYGLTV